LHFEAPAFLIGGNHGKRPERRFFPAGWRLGVVRAHFIRKREDYLKPFRVLRCKIDDQVDFQAPESVGSATEATVLIEIFGEEELVAGSGQGPVHAVDNAMRKILEKHYPQLAEVRLDEFDVRLLHHGRATSEDDENGAAALVRVLAIFSDGKESWGTVGVAADILRSQC